METSTGREQRSSDPSLSPATSARDSSRNVKTENAPFTVKSAGHSTKTENSEDEGIEVLYHGKLRKSTELPQQKKPSKTGVSYNSIKREREANDEMAKASSKRTDEEAKVESTREDRSDASEVSLFRDAAAIRRTDARLQSYIRKENLADKLAGNEVPSNRNGDSKKSKERGLISDETLLDKQSM